MLPYQFSILVRPHSSIQAVRLSMLQKMFSSVGEDESPLRRARSSEELMSRWKQPRGLLSSIRRGPQGHQRRWHHQETTHLVQSERCFPCTEGAEEVGTTRTSLLLLRRPHRQSAWRCEVFYRCHRRGQGSRSWFWIVEAVYICFTSPSAQNSSAKWSRRNARSPTRLQERLPPMMTAAHLPQARFDADLTIEESRTRTATCFISLLKVDEEQADHHLLALLLLHRR